MKASGWAVALSLLVGFVPAQAAAEMVVVELFTAQGCPACPPADKVLTSVSEGRNVLALSWAVDYWDYAGWKDTFAAPENTARQEQYNQNLGYKTLYTPQMIINGRRQTVGSREKEVRELVMASGEDLWVDVSIDEEGDGFTAKVEGATYDAAADVILVWFDREKSVEVKYGDNSGRELRYVNVVRGFRKIGSWTGREMEMPIDLGEIGTSDAFAVLVQASEGGPIIGAAKQVRLN